MSRIFIGRLPHDARESDVDRFMRGYGTIRDVTLKKGYGFVEFDDYRDAEDAIDDLNGKELLGERVTLEFARGRRSGGGGRGGGRDSYSYRGDRSDRGGDSYRGGGGGRGGYNSSSRRPDWLDKYGPPVRTRHVAIVENLSHRTSWQDLKDYCRKVGKVTYADAHKHRTGEGTVEFTSSDDLADAISKLDDTELGGRRIRIYEEKRRDHHRSKSRSRSRSRSPRRKSRSRSRSRSRSASPPHKRGGRSPRSRSPSRSKSRSRSPVKSHSRSRSPATKENPDEGRDTD